MIHLNIHRLLSLFSPPFFLVSPGTFSPPERIDIHAGLSEYQWLLLMQFNFSHLGCCPVSQNKKCVFVHSDSNHVIILSECKTTTTAFPSPKHVCNRFFILSSLDTLQRSCYLHFLDMISSKSKVWRKKHSILYSCICFKDFIKTEIKSKSKSQH